MVRLVIGCIVGLSVCCLANAQALDPNASAILATRGGAVVRISDVDSILEGVKSEQRSEVVSSAARVEQLLDARLLAVQLSNKGRTMKLDEDPEVRRRLAIQTEKALGEIVLDVLVKRRESGNLETLAKETYAGKKKEFFRKESWTVRHLLLKAKDGESNDELRVRSEKLYQQAIGSPATFEALVKTKSDDPSVSQNEGAFTIGRDSDFVREFLDAGFKLTKPQQFAPLTKTQFGFHVIQLLEMSPSKQLTYDEVRFQLLADLDESFRERVKAEILSDLRAADPKYVEENIRKLVARYDPPEQSASVNSELPTSVPDSGAPK